MVALGAVGRRAGRRASLGSGSSPALRAEGGSPVPGGQHGGRPRGGVGRKSPPAPTAEASPRAITTQDAANRARHRRQNVESAARSAAAHNAQGAGGAARGTADELDIARLLRGFELLRV